MNTSIHPIQYPLPNGGVQPFNDSSQPTGKASTGRRSSVLVSLTALLAGALFLLCGAPAARADRVPAACSGSGLGITLYTDVADAHVGDVLFYGITVFNGIIGGTNIVCDATEIKAYITTPDGVTYSIPLTRTTLHAGQADFYPRAIGYVVRAQDIQPDGTVRARATDTGVIHQNDTNSEGGGEQGVNTEISLPCIRITAQCVSSVGENGAITITGTVTNCGNNLLTGVTVTNYVDGGAYTFLYPTNLEIGKGLSFTGTYVPLNPCVPSTATLIVQGSDAFTAVPKVVTSSTKTTCQNVLTPGIKVTKVCPKDPVSPGQMLTFSGTVSNTGNVTLTNIVVVNNQPAPNTKVFTQLSLAPGAVVAFTGSYLAPTNCSVTDTLTASASSVCGVGVTDTASATCPILTNPGLAVTASCPTNVVPPGGVVTYTGTVRNTGDITLTKVVVTSDRPVADTVVFTAASLAPGESASYSASATMPLDGCAATTRIAAIGYDLCTTVAAKATTAINCSSKTAPGLVVSLTCPTATTVAGTPMTYTGTVRNSGDITLTNVWVVNNSPITNTLAGPLTLAPGAVSSFTSTFAAPLDQCSVTAKVTAAGVDNCSGLAVYNSASATCTLITAPAIAITQACPVTPGIPGGPVIYTGTVKNTGNITLTNVVIVNDKSGTTPIFTTNLLTPGTVATFSGSYIGPTNCSSTSTSTVTGQSLCGDAVTRSASTTCLIQTAPAIQVTVACPAAPVPQGGILTFSGTVSNPGNITLTNVIVVNNWPIHGMVVKTLASLAPGEVQPFTGSIVVPANCCVAWNTVVATGQDCSGATVSDSDSGTCPVLTQGRIVVTKACTTSGLLRPGDLLTYSGTVSNAGNIVLVNVSVVNNLSSGNLLPGLVALAPGESIPYTASYVVPPDFCGTDTVTASGLNGCSFATVANSVTITCPVLTAPRIVVTQACPDKPAVHGSTVTFSGTVENPGNVTLTNVYVVANQPAVYILGPITLTPGQVVKFNGTYVAPALCCQMVNTLTATGRDRCSGSSVTATATSVCPLLYTPGLTVTPNCPAKLPAAGDVVALNGIVSNTGDAILTNVLVFTVQGGTNLLLLGPTDLAPGESEAYSGSITVASDARNIAVTATGQETCAGKTVNHTGTCPVATSALLTITQGCPTTPPVQNSLLTYSGSVSNAGGITLSNIMVTNDRSGTTAILTVARLLPGESAPFTGSYIATTAPVSTSTSTATAVSASGEPVTATFVSSCTTVRLVTPASLKVPALKYHNGIATLSFATESGVTYAVQYVNSLGDSTWTTLQTSVGNGGTMSITDSSAPNQTMRHYRVILAPK